MLLKDFLNKSLVFADLHPENKISLLEKLVEKIGDKIPSINKPSLLQKLKKREEEITTVIGHGVAVPHATIDGLSKTLCLLAQVPEGVNFGLGESDNVHIVFLLLSPTGCIGTHIKLLARIARLVNNEPFIKKVSTAQTPEKIYELVVEEDTHHVN